MGTNLKLRPKIISMGYILHNDRARSLRPGPSHVLLGPWCNRTAPIKSGRVVEPTITIMRGVWKDVNETLECAKN